MKLFPQLLALFVYGQALAAGIGHDPFKSQKPVILSIDGYAPAKAVAVSKKPVLVASPAFYGGRPSAATWVIAADPAFNSVVATASTTNRALLTSIAVKPAHLTFLNCPLNRRELEVATTYFARVKYESSDGVSAWSDPVSFTTTPLYVSDPADVPVISLPDIAQSDFQAAFDVLESLIIPDPVSRFGDYNFFLYPCQCPGAGYGYGWWQFDQNAMIGAEKWTGLNFSDDVMRNWFLDQQANGNGHIDEVFFWLADNQGSTGQPTFFAAAYDLARRSTDPTFALDLYNSMKGLYGWFRNYRLNEPTGLVTTADDEGIIRLAKFVDDNAAASVDLNVLLALAARDLAALAATLAPAEVSYFQNEAAQAAQAINTFLWDASAGLYRNRWASYPSFVEFHDAGTFYPLRGNIAGPDRTPQLLAALTDPSNFNWDASPASSTFACTTLSRTDPCYMNFYEPLYPQGYSSQAWLGNIWTVVNFQLVRGLADSGRADLSAALMHQTLRLVNANYYEWFLPDGTPAGSPSYGWTAANCAQLIIEDLFGIDYDAFSNTIAVTPRIPAAYSNVPIAISNVNLPTTGDKLSVAISPYSNGARTISVSTDNPNSTYNLRLCVPTVYGAAATRLLDASTRKEIKHSKEKLSFQAVDQDGDGKTEAYLVSTSLSKRNNSCVACTACTTDLPR